MTFRVGMKVVCVDASRGRGEPDPPLVEGAVYTVASVRYFDQAVSRDAPGYGVTLLEVSSVETDEYWAEYRSERFRPAVEPKSETSFTQGAPIDSEQWDNRRVVVTPEKVMTAFPREVQS